ncbi:hypothetical protein BSKO_11449 [Bryopsis sp. KO-2023]|nr:hypothetical protein BSKO_11449 [Bryopsis sp. KO-2023]
MCSTSAAAGARVDGRLTARPAFSRGVRGLPAKRLEKLQPSAQRFEERWESVGGQVMQAAVLANIAFPLEAHAAMEMTPSIKNLLFTLVAGFTCLALFGIVFSGSDT